MTLLSRHSLWLAPLLAFAGFISYFLIFARYPVTRDFPWVNLPLVLIGAGMAVGGLMKGWKVSRWPRRLLLLASSFFSVAVAGLLVLYVFVFSNQMPAAAGVEEKLAAGSAAPDFSLSDANGDPVSLGNYRGKRVVLVFYRGFW